MEFNKPGPEAFVLVPRCNLKRLTNVAKNQSWIVHLDAAEPKRSLLLTTFTASLIPTLTTPFTAKATITANGRTFVPVQRIDCQDDSNSYAAWLLFDLEAIQGTSSKPQLFLDIASAETPVPSEMSLPPFR